MRLALDTNVLAYAEGLNDADRRGRALSLLRKLNLANVYLPAQALGELFHILVRKAGLPAGEARLIVLRWCNQYPLIETSQFVLFSAMELSSQHQLHIWDAIMLSAAASAGCRLFLSEDLQDGFTWSGITVVNPFSKSPHELLVQALES
jgi:predicted nucleic acid-binding protein